MTRSIKDTLRSIDAHPKQSLGQNFCVDDNILDKIVEAVKIQGGDTVVEIGAGTGALTAHLARTGCELTSIEIDQRFQPILQERFGNQKNVDLRFADALQVLPEILEQGPGNTIVVGNLPYNIGSPIVFCLLEYRTRVCRAIVTLQMEMARRLTSPPGSREYGGISVRLQAASTLDYLFRIKPTCFYPAPKVESGCLRIDFSAAPDLKPRDEKIFADVVRAAFSQRRKQLQNSLKTSYSADMVMRALDQAQIVPTIRAEMLGVAEFIALADALFSLARP